MDLHGSPEQLLLRAANAEALVISHEGYIAKLEAELANMRQRLQLAHGALFVLTQPDAAKSLQELYDVSKLLEDTRPDKVSGLPLLQRVREMEASRK